MSKEKIIEKVQKLLALSNSSNEHEAKLAMENANKLLTKYNLSMKDVEEVHSDIIEHVVERSGRISKWRIVLLQSIAELNFCEVLYLQRINKPKDLIIVGKDHNIIVAIEIYRYLVQFLDRNVKENTKHISCKNSYRIGFSLAIRKRVNQIIIDRENEGINGHSGDECKDLMIVEKYAVKEYLNEQNIKTQKNYLKDDYDFESFMKGSLDGQNISLNQQIKGE